MVRFLKIFWKSLLFLGSFIGLLFLASDIQDIPSAITGWRTAFTIIDQLTALWIFAVFALAYIIWIDARPIIEKWRKGEKTEISVLPNLVWFAGKCGNFGGVKYYVNVCYLVVFNNGRSRKTATGVRVSTSLTGDATSQKTKTGYHEVALNHGERAFFKIGSVVSTNLFGSFDMELRPTEIDLAFAEHSAPIGRFPLSVEGTGAFEISERFGSDGVIKFLRLHVSAKNLPSIDVSLRSVGSELERQDNVPPRPILIESIKQA